jgi:hypothetical protein
MEIRRISKIKAKRERKSSVLPNFEKEYNARKKKLFGQENVVL